MLNKIRQININNFIFIAMILGFLVGMILNLWVPESFFKNTILIDNIFYFGSTAFINLMKMLVVPLVFCSIVVGTASIINTKKIGNITIEIIILYLGTTLIAVCIAILLASLIQPGNGLNMIGSVYTSNVTSNVTLTDKCDKQFSSPL